MSYSKQSWRTIAFIPFHQLQHSDNYCPQRKRLTLWWWLTNSLGRFWFQLLIHYDFKDRKKPPCISCSLRQHRKQRTTFQIPLPNLAKKCIKERCSFSSHSSKQILWWLHYMSGLPRARTKSFECCFWFYFEWVSSNSPHYHINQSNATSDSSLCPPRTVIQIYCYFTSLSTFKLLSLGLCLCPVIRSNGISIL